MYVGTILKKDNSVEIKTIKIELIKENFDEKLSSIKLKPEKITAPGIVLITPSIIIIMDRSKTGIKYTGEDITSLYLI